MTAKQIHAEFINQINNILIDFGAEKKIYSPKCEYRDVVYEYCLDTCAGFVVFQPEIPILGSHEKYIARKDYWLGVFGKFVNPEIAKQFVDCNPFSGKWNFCFGRACEVKKEDAILTINAFTQNFWFHVNRIHKKH